MSRFEEIKGRSATLGSESARIDLNDYGDELWMGGSKQGMATLHYGAANVKAYIGLFRRTNSQNAARREAVAQALAHAPADLALLVEAVERLEAIRQAQVALLAAYRLGSVPGERAMRQVDVIPTHVTWLRERGVIS